MLMESEKGDASVSSSSVPATNSTWFGASMLRPSVLTGKLKPLNAEPSLIPTSSPTSMALSDVSTLSPVVLKSTAPVPSVPSNTEYVFGQNMLSRVVNAEHGCSANLWQAAAEVAASSNVSESPLSDNPDSVFTVLAKAAASNNSMTPSSSSHSLELKESANELVRKRTAAQIKLTEAPNLTGEENERIVLQLSCNAYVFNSDSRQWTSIGQSYLHLNDELTTDKKSVSASRLIIRLQSTRRVVVNTRIWQEMSLAIVESKGVRIAALEPDGAGIRNYLLRFQTPQNATKLYECITFRKKDAEKLTQTENKRMRLSNNVDCSLGATDVPKITLTSPGKSSEPPQLDSIVALHDSTNISVRAPSPNTPSANSSSESIACEQLLCNGTSSHKPKKSGTLFLNLCCRVASPNLNEPSIAGSIQITDFLAGGPSILEICNETGSASISILTTTIGFRLAFCFVDNLSIHIFVSQNCSDVDSGSQNSLELDANENRMSPYFLKMNSHSDAVRLYRSMLLRINRLFIEENYAQSSSLQSGSLSAAEETDKISARPKTVEA